MTASDSDADDATGSSTSERIRRYAPWVVGGLLLFMGAGAILFQDGNALRSIVAGILFLVAGAVAFPPTRSLLNDRSGVQFTGWTVAIVVIVATVGATAVLPPTPDEQAPGGDTPIDGETPDDPTPDEDRPADDTKETTPTPGGTEGAPPTSTDRPRGVRRIAAETYGDYGMVTGISPDGSYAAFGLHTGDLVVYDVAADSFESRPTGIDRRPSHIELRNDGYATVAWMDAHTYGGVDLTTADGIEWANEYPGLWTIDTNPDHSSVAAVTYPDEGEGRVGVATRDGEIRWDEPIEDAASESVAVSDDGDRVAVGAIEYYTDGVDSAGTPGIRLHDGRTGEELWRYETATETWAVDIDADEGLVAAATDERLIVLDLDGNVVWEDDTAGSLWVGISDDGSSVVTFDEGGPVAYRATSGEERWRADDAPGYVFGGRVAMSADGSRVVATETVGWTYVVDEGEVIWQEEREDNPANVDISADGTTWSIIVQDNDTEEAHVFVYRDNEDGT